MAQDFKSGPKSVHPEQPSAVGSRNSLNRDGRDEYAEGRLVVDEEVDKILNHVEAKLPPEVLENLEVMGNIKGALHTYYNQSMQNMLNRYLSTVEDEMGKKVRELIDKDEHANLNRYTPREMAKLINDVGGPETFNTQEVEQSNINIMGHLQGHIQRGAYEFETRTTDILLQQGDIGAFIRGENSYAVIKASMRDNAKKPDKVVDIKLAINVLDSELISQIIPHQMLSDTLIKEVISGRIQELLGKEIEEINNQLSVEGRKELSSTESIFEKMKAMENYLKEENGHATADELLPRHYLERIQGMGAEVSKMDYDDLGLKESIGKLLEAEGLRQRGWGTAVNSITSILDNARMGYQHVENYRNARRAIIREYEENDYSRLPDERFEIEVRYMDRSQIREEQAAYTAQMEEFRREVLRLWDVVEEMYQEQKRATNTEDWDDLYSKTAGAAGGQAGKGWFQGGAKGDAPPRHWNEITFIQRKLNTLEEMNQTYESLADDFKGRFRTIRQKLAQGYGLNFPDQRQLVEQRLNFLEEKFQEFSSRINPYHMQPGLLLDVSLTSIKRLKVTIRGMANVLNEFLLGMSKGYTDKNAAPTIKHRRTHIEEKPGFEG